LTGYDAIGQYFSPEMGFVRQNNLRRSSSFVTYTQWVNKKSIRNLVYNGSFEYDTLYNREFLGRRYTGGIALQLESFDSFNYTLDTASERIYRPFNVGPITINPGDYHNRIHRVLFTSSPRRFLKGIIDYQDMKYWSGERSQLLISSNIRPFAELSIDFIYTYNAVDHPNGSFNTTTLSNRILYAFKPELFVKSYVQWNDLEKRFSFDFLASYEYRPGSDIALVYNEIRDRFQSPHLAPRDRILLIKWTYNLRF
jgi:hypothetical protein